MQGHLRPWPAAYYRALRSPRQAPPQRGEIQLVCNDISGWNFGPNNDRLSRQLDRPPAESLGVEVENGRGGQIRTGGPLHPMQVRYRAAPRPDPILRYHGLNLVASAGSATSALSSGFGLLFLDWGGGLHKLCFVHEQRYGYRHHRQSY